MCAISVKPYGTIETHLRKVSNGTFFPPKVALHLPVTNTVHTLQTSSLLTRKQKGTICFLNFFFNKCIILYKDIQQ